MTEADLIRHIHEAGTAPGFGGAKGRDYQAEQVPEELAAAVHFIQQEHQPRCYLEIGGGAVSTSRLMNDFFHFDKLHIVDKNDLPKHASKSRNIPQAIEWTGNSHSDECDQALTKWSVAFDLILIDGDHSYEGVRQDTYLAIKHAASPCIILYHDAVSGKAVARWLTELKQGKVPGLTYLQTFGTRLGLAACHWSEI